MSPQTAPGRPLGVAVGLSVHCDDPEQVEAVLRELNGVAARVAFTSSSVHLTLVPMADEPHEPPPAPEEPCPAPAAPSHGEETRYVAAECACCPEDAAPPSRGEGAPWATGRTILGRPVRVGASWAAHGGLTTLVAVGSKPPDDRGRRADDTLIGMIISPDVARHIVDCVSTMETMNPVLSAPPGYVKSEPVS